MNHSHINQHAQRNKLAQGKQTTGSQASRDKLSSGQSSAKRGGHKTFNGADSGLRQRAIPRSASMVNGMSSAKRKAIKVKAMANNLARIARRYPRQLIEALDVVDSDTSIS